MAIEEPTYTVIEATEAFELRAYEPMIVAETAFQAPWTKHLGQDLKLLQVTFLVIIRRVLV